MVMVLDMCIVLLAVGATLLKRVASDIHLRGKGELKHAVLTAWPPALCARKAVSMSDPRTGSGAILWTFVGSSASST